LVTFFRFPVFCKKRSTGRRKKCVLQGGNRAACSLGTAPVLDLAAGKKTDRDKQCFDRARLGELLPNSRSCASVIIAERQNPWSPRFIRKIEALGRGLSLHPMNRESKPSQ
jgi:hypothetical protein